MRQKNRGDTYENSSFVGVAPLQVPRINFA